MNRIMHGVIRGKSVELTEDPGIADGQEVQIVLTVVPSAATWGDGIRRSAGGWAEDPEMDTVMARIQEDRQRERPPQGP